MEKRKQGNAEDPDPTPARRQKIRYTCRIRGCEKPSKMFPDYNPSADCQHNINICKSCLKTYVDTQIRGANTTIRRDDGTTFGIKCPECPAIMIAVNIENAASKEMFAQFEKLERVYIGNITPGWRWCLSPSCDSGQVQESAPDGQGRDIFKCEKCGERACVPCDRSYHTVESCEAYQLSIKDRLEEDDRTLEAIQRDTKPRPHCTVRIHKTEGCDHMMCAHCKEEFDWSAVPV